MRAVFISCRCRRKVNIRLCGRSSILGNATVFLIMKTSQALGRFERQFAYCSRRAGRGGAGSRCARAALLDENKRLAIVCTLPWQPFAPFLSVFCVLIGVVLAENAFVSPID
jgi:hypothetical protein